MAIEDDIAVIREEQRKSNKGFEARIAALIQQVQDELSTAKIQVTELEVALERCKSAMVIDEAKR